MKRKIFYIILPIFLFFFNVNVVFADDSVDCGDQQKKIDEYTIINEKLSSLDCTKTNDVNIVTACNDYNSRKNIIVIELMKLNEKKDICSDKQEAVNKIIDENEKKCGKIFDDTFYDLVNKFMVAFYILGPILLILFGSLDFAKATVSAEQDALRKAWKNFSKRIAATILLFATPTIVNLIISFNVSGRYLTGNAYSCNFNYLVYTKNYNIKYVPKQNSSTNSNVDGDFLKAAELVHKEYETEKWTYSTDLVISNNIEASATNKTNTTCCATFVAVALYKAGYFTEQEINSSSYNAAQGVYDFLKKNKWIVINDYDNLVAGDIVFMDYEPNGVMNHVQIYAGDGTWYNAGSTDSIRKDSPYAANERYRFTVALRKP